jgi:hypothetical protein
MGSFHSAGLLFPFFFSDIEINGAGILGMAFSSNFFIFAYLPTVLILYFACPSSARNFTLLVASVAFYAFDAGSLVWLLIVSILLNYFAGWEIARRKVAGATIGISVSREFQPALPVEQHH